MATLCGALYHMRRKSGLDEKHPGLAVGVALLNMMLLCLLLAHLLASVTAL